MIFFSGFSDLVCQQLFQISALLWLYARCLIFPAQRSPRYESGTRLVLQKLTDADQVIPLLPWVPRVSLFFHRCSSSFLLTVASIFIFPSSFLLENRDTQKLCSLRATGRPLDQRIIEDHGTQSLVSIGESADARKLRR